MNYSNGLPMPEEVISQMIEYKLVNGLSYATIGRIFESSRQAIQQLIGWRIDRQDMLEVSSKKRIGNRIDLFHTMYTKEDNGCWVWNGKLNDQGYGIFGLYEIQGAHRVSVIIHGGSIPKDKIVCHQCNDRACVNPKHLFVGDQGDNMIDKRRIFYIEQLKSLECLYKECKRTNPQDNPKIKDLVKFFNISSMTLHRMVKSKYWPCIDGVHTFDWANN